MDRISRVVRSRNMEAVKASNNKSTEQALVIFFRKNHIVGWRRGNKKVFGKPDFIFFKKHVAVFVDGCFWHGCRKHRSIPKTNNKFWIEKIKNNTVRDRKVNLILKRRGWKVVRVWEHQLKPKNRKTSLPVLSKALG